MYAISARPCDYDFDSSGLDPGPSRAIIPAMAAMIGWTGTSDQVLDALARL